MVLAVRLPLDMQDPLLERGGVRIALVLQFQVRQRGQHRHEVRVIRAEHGFLQRQGPLVVLGRRPIFARFFVLGIVAAVLLYLIVLSSLQIFS